MTRWHDTMVDRPESDHEAGYAAGWTISGLAMLGAIVTVRPSPRHSRPASNRRFSDIRRKQSSC